LTRTIARLPKVELHLHLEGCLTPFEASVLARRSGSSSAAPHIAPLYRHASFAEFLRHFGALMDLFRSPDDLVWLFRRTAARLRRQNVLHAEIRVSPSVWERHGLEPRSGLKALLEEGRHAPLSVLFVVDAVRQWDRSLLARDLDLALEHRGKGVCAFGLGGDETAAPASLFGDLSAECRAARLPVLPHAGEMGGADEVASALKVFDPPRVGHGIGAAGDVEVLRAVARAGVHLEVCPTSNRCTGAVPARGRHPLPVLWKAGASLSLNTDDPALFATTLNRELAWAAARAGWTIEDAARSQRMAARASLLPAGARRDLEARLW
jgi:adenosine deaminase